MRTGYIYIIKNTCNNKVYIGQTTLSVEERFKQHLKPSQIKRCRYKLYKAMEKYGKENFYVETLESDVPYDKLDEREIYYINMYDSFHNGYNSTQGGDTKTIYKIDDIQEIVERLKSGDLIKDIAADYSVHPCTIRRSLKAYGIDSFKVQDHSTKEYLRNLPREEIKELYSQGFSHKEIACKLNVNPRSVSRVIKEFGIGKKNMVDYSSLNLSDVLSDVEKWERGEIKKKDILQKYNLNQHSISHIRKLLNNPKETLID